MVSLTFLGAKIREQGVDFAIVVVKNHVIHNITEAQRIIRGFQRQVFPGIPVILMARDYSKRVSYRGRDDIVRFMKSVPLRAIPWKRFTVTL